MEMNENKLIAEYMGLKFNKGTMYNMGYDVFGDGNLHRTHELQYHKDWNWLMPVVQRFSDTDKYLGEQDEQDLMQTLLYGYIDDVYKLVVELIQEYRLTPKEVI